MELVNNALNIGVYVASGSSLDGDIGSGVNTSSVSCVIFAIGSVGDGALADHEVKVLVDPATTAAVVTVVDGAIDQVLLGDSHRRSIVFDGSQTLGND